jgi:hypothetical protein
MHVTMTRRHTVLSYATKVTGDGGRARLSTSVITRRCKDDCVVIDEKEHHRGGGGPGRERKPSDHSFTVDDGYSWRERFAVNGSGFPVNGSRRRERKFL